MLEALEAQVKLSKTVEARAMKKLGPAGHQYQSQKAKNLWNTAKRKSLKVVRDAKKKAEELMLWENQLVSARNQVIHSKTGGVSRIHALLAAGKWCQGHFMSNDNPSLLSVHTELRPHCARHVERASASHPGAPKRV